MLLDIKRIYAVKAVWKTFLFGVLSGFLLLLTGNSLNFWLASSGVGIETVGLFAAVALPYSLKYAIAPLLENINFYHRILGWYRTLFLVTQLSVILLLYFIGDVNPLANITIFAIYAFFISFFAVCQDVILDSSKIRLIKKSFTGSGSATYILGYRAGMLISGAGAIILSEYLSWGSLYQIAALLVLIISVIVFFALPSDADHQNEAGFSRGWRDIFIKPFHHLGGIKNLGLILIFLILYRLPDNLIMNMTNVFFLQKGFSVDDIGYVVKLYGGICAIIGGLVAGYCIEKYGIYRNILYNGAIHFVSNLLLLLMCYFSNNITILWLVIVPEAITGGMVMTSYIAYITGLCKASFSATQYALFSSMIGISRTIIPSSAGFIVENTSWPFFIICASMFALPSFWIFMKLHEGENV